MPNTVNPSIQPRVLFSLQAFEGINLLSKSKALLRVVFEGGFYWRIYGRYTAQNATIYIVSFHEIQNPKIVTAKAHFYCLLL